MRLLASVLTAAALVATAGPAHAAVNTSGETYVTNRVVVPIVFPVIGATNFTDTFLACRSGCARKHMGQDLMGPKMSALVAACDGTVVSMKREVKVGGGNYLVIACDHGAGAGWSAFYMHINNDTPGTDDGKGTKSWAFPSGLAVGVRVLAGQHVGWRGDSGDAESTGAHLHFELRKGTGWGGVVYNAFPSLLAAKRLTVPRPAGPHPDGTLMRAPAGNLFVVKGLQKQLVSSGVAAANGLSDPVPAAAGEVARYATVAPLPLRDGALVKDSAGGVWRVLGSSRFAVTPAAGQRVTPVAATDLSGLKIVDPPASLLTSGVLVRAAGVVYAVGADGLVHSVSGYVMASWGWTAADVVNFPLDLLLPEVGSPLTLRDGTLVVGVPGDTLGVVSGGVLRRIWDTRELRAYGYAGQRRLRVPAALVVGLPVDELAAGPSDPWRHNR